MTKPRDRDEAGRLQYETEHTRPIDRRPSVLGYLVILAVVAFFLLLMAFFMQKRTDQLEDSIQQSSHSAVQSIENLMAERDKLQDRVRELEDRLEGLSGEAADAREELEQARQDLGALAGAAQTRADALSRLNELRALYNRSRYTDARALLGDAHQRAALRQALEQVSDSLTADQRAIYDPLSAYDTLLGWMGIRD